MHTIVSNASCTTNALAPLAKALDDLAGIEHGFMTTVHAYTQEQSLQDGAHRDARRARAAGVNIVPTTTGAAKAIGLVPPNLDGKLSGDSIRVPVPVGSIVELNTTVARDVTRDDVLAAYRAAAEGPPAGVLEYSEDPLVSSDIVGNPASSIFGEDRLTTLPATAFPLSATDTEGARLLQTVGVPTGTFSMREPDEDSGRLPLVQDVVDAKDFEDASEDRAEWSYEYGRLGRTARPARRSPRSVPGASLSAVGPRLCCQPAGVTSVSFQRWLEPELGDARRPRRRRRSWTGRRRRRVGRWPR